MSSVRLDQQDAAQLLGYTGFARRIAPDLSWEAGVRYARFTGEESYAYAEAYVGLTYKQFVGRVYYSPDYFSSGSPVLYAELNDSRSIGGPWYVFAHMGYLRRNGEVTDEPTGRVRSDFRAGAGLVLESWNLQLSWATTHGAPDYAFGYPTATNATRDAWILSVSHAW